MRDRFAHANQLSKRLVISPSTSTGATAVKFDMDAIASKGVGEGEDGSSTAEGQGRESTSGNDASTPVHLPEQAPQKLPSIPAPYEAPLVNGGEASYSTPAAQETSLVGGDGKELMFVRDIKTGKMVPLSEIDVFSIEHDDEDDDDDDDERDDDEDDKADDARGKSNETLSQGDDLVGALSAWGTGVFNRIATATTATVKGMQGRPKKP